MVAAVEPKLVRFYDNLFAMGALCDQDRPMYGAPAGLCGTDVERIGASLTRPRGAQRRRINELVADPVGWLVDERPLGGGLGSREGAWPAGEVTRLLVDNGHMGRLGAQHELLGLLVPDR